MKSNRQKQRFCHPKMADLKAWSHGVRKANSLFCTNTDNGLLDMATVTLCNVETLNCNFSLLKEIVQQGLLEFALRGCSYEPG